MYYMIEILLRDARIQMSIWSQKRLRQTKSEPHFHSESDMDMRIVVLILGFPHHQMSPDTFEV